LSFPFIWWCWKNIPSTSIHKGWMRKCSKSYVKTENGGTTREEKNKLKSWAMAWKIGNCKRCWNAFSGLIYIYCHCNAWCLFELDGLYSLLFVDLGLFDFINKIFLKKCMKLKQKNFRTVEWLHHWIAILIMDFRIRTLKCFNINLIFNLIYFCRNGLNLDLKSVM